MTEENESVSSVRNECNHREIPKLLAHLKISVNQTSIAKGKIVDIFSKKMLLRGENGLFSQNEGDAAPTYGKNEIGYHSQRSLIAFSTFLPWQKSDSSVKSEGFSIDWTAIAGDIVNSILRKKCSRNMCRKKNFFSRRIIANCLSGTFCLAVIWCKEVSQSFKTTRVPHKYKGVSWDFDGWNQSGRFWRSSNIEHRKKSWIIVTRFLEFSIF